MTEEGVGKPSSDVVTRAPRTGRKPRCSPSLCKACRRRVHARGRGISEGAQPGEGLGTGAFLLRLTARSRKSKWQRVCHP